MKCQILFARKTAKYFKMLSAKHLSSMLSINEKNSESFNFSVGIKKHAKKIY